MSWGKGGQANSSTQLEKGGQKNTEDESIIDFLKTKSAGKSRKDVKELLTKYLKISERVSGYLSDQLVSCIENRESIKCVYDYLQLKYSPSSSAKTIISFFDKKQTQLMKSKTDLERSVDVGRFKEVFDMISRSKYDEAIQITKKNIQDDLLCKIMQNTIVELRETDREARDLFQLIFKSKDTNFYLLGNAGNKYQKGSSAIALIFQQLNNRYIQLRQFRDSFEQIGLVNKILIKSDVKKFQKLLQRYVDFAKTADKEFADLYFIKESYEKIMTYQKSIQNSTDPKHCAVTLNLNKDQYRKQVEFFQEKMEEILNQHRTLKFESLLPEKAKASWAEAESGSSKKEKDSLQKVSLISESINQGKRIKQLYQRIAQLQVQLDSFSSQKQKDQVKIRLESKTKIEQLSKEITQNQKIIVQKEIQIKQLKQKQFSQLQTKLKAKEQQFQLKLRKQVSEWQNKLRISNKANEEQKKQLQKLTESKKEIQRSLARCQHQKLQQKVNKMQSIILIKLQQVLGHQSIEQKAFAKIQALLKRVEQADLKNEQKQSEITELKKAIQKYTCEIEELRKFGKQELVFDLSLIDSVRKEEE